MVGGWVGGWWAEKDGWPRGQQVELLRRCGTGGAEAVAQRELLVRCAALEEENGGLREHSRAAAQEMAALKLQLLRAEQAMEAQEYHMQSREVLLEVCQRVPKTPQVCCRFCALSTMS